MRTMSNMEELVNEYKLECCKFDDETCIKMLQLYLDRMEDSHFKCVLYMHLRHLENDKPSVGDELFDFGDTFGKVFGG